MVGAKKKCPMSRFDWGQSKLRNGRLIEMFDVVVIGPSRLPTAGRHSVVQLNRSKLRVVKTQSEGYQCKTAAHLEVYLLYSITTTLHIPARGCFDSVFSRISTRPDLPRGN